MAAPSEVCVSDRSFAGNAGSNPAGVMDVCLFVNVACRQIEVSAKGRSVIQKSPTECVCVCVCVCVSDCDQVHQQPSTTTGTQKNLRRCCF